MFLKLIIFYKLRDEKQGERYNADAHKSSAADHHHDQHEEEDKDAFEEAEADNAHGATDYVKKSDHHRELG